MKDVYNHPDFGSIVAKGIDDEGDLVEVSESYFGDKLRTIHVAKTRVIKTEGFLDAAEKSLQELHRLLRSNICHDSVTVRYEINPKDFDIRKVHVTHIPRREQVDTEIY